MSRALATRDDWPGRIRSAWQKSVEGILETGHLLVQAKRSLPHGAFEAMVESELPFTTRTAQMLMAIGEDKRLSKAKHVSYLPPSWGTLYELTKLDDKTWGIAEERGLIRPDVERSAISALRREATGRPSTDSAPKFDMVLAVAGLHDQIVAVFDRCSGSERIYVINDLRAFLITLASRKSA